MPFDCVSHGTEDDPRPAHASHAVLLPLLFLPPLSLPLLGHFLPAIRIHLLSLPVVSVPAFVPGHLVYSCPLPPSLPLSLAHLRIPVSYFDIQPDTLPAAPLGRHRPAMEGGGGGGRYRGREGQLKVLSAHKNG